MGVYTGVNPAATGAIFSTAAGATSLGKSLYKKELDNAKTKAVEEFSELF